MKVYIFALILATTLANAAERKNVIINTGISRTRNESSKRFNLFVFLCALSLVLIAGLRYNVGTDYIGYVTSFERRSETWFSDLLNWKEPGIGFIGAISKFMGGGPYLMLFMVSAIIIFLYVATIRKHSDDFALAIALYILIGCWHNSFNGLRQYLAASILFAGHGFLKERKLIKWIIVVGIASLFHRTAIVLFPVYFVADEKLDWKRIIIIVVFTIVLLLSSDVLFSIMEDLKGKDQSQLEYANRSVKSLRIIVTFAPLALAVIRGKEFFKDPENAFYIKMLIINAGFMLATSSSAYLARVGIYTEIYTAMGIPRLIKGMSTKNKNIWIVIIVGLYIIFWWYELSSRASLVNWHWLFD